MKPRKPWWVRLLIALGTLIGVLALLAAALYFYGGMGSSANDPAMRQQYEQMVQAGQVARVQERFVIRIPGCTCHSADPVQTQMHRYYRMSECMQSGCHGS